MANYYLACSERRSLYECLQAKVLGKRIYCKEGHSLNGHNLKSKVVIPGSLSLTRLQRGDPLEIEACQSCEDFHPMDGGKVAPRDRGWYQLTTEKVEMN